MFFAYKPYFCKSRIPRSEIFITTGIQIHAAIECTPFYRRSRPGKKYTRRLQKEIEIYVKLVFSPHHHHHQTRCLKAIAGSADSCLGCEIRFTKVVNHQGFDSCQSNQNQFGSCLIRKYNFNPQRKTKKRLKGCSLRCIIVHI